MARRRSYFAELQHQQKVRERAQARAQRDADREYKRLVREAEAARRAEAQAAKRLERANAAERKRLEKEAQLAHVETMTTTTQRKNYQLESINEELGSLLSATLDVDDFVDLEQLRYVAAHPPFSRPDLTQPTPRPPEPQWPSAPKLQLTPPPSGMFSFLQKNNHANQVALEQELHERAVAAWKDQMRALRAEYLDRRKAHVIHEKQRVAALAEARGRYMAECSEREQQGAKHDEAVDALIANLGYGVPEAVEQYIAIVLSNSVYPDHFPVEHEFSFDPAEAELKLRVFIPAPDSISATKAFKYVKSKDEITESTLSQKAQKDRYASVVHQVALRSIHEVFEADRRALISTVALEVGVNTIDPATGLPTYVPFALAAAERISFLAFDLSAVVPLATLQHLGASLSKNPFGLVPAQLKGVRRA